jgi:glycosyltransferase involved in cell wall biosynthesis
MLRLAIVTTHPIQYYAPIFQALARMPGIQPHVFYTWSQSAHSVADVDFGRAISWDLPLLEGYELEFVPNVAARPGTHHFWGLRNPTLIDAIERRQPDAILVFGWNSASHLAVLRHFKARVPVFFRGDSTLLDPLPSLKKGARRMLLSWIYRHVDVAVAVGSNNRDYYRWCGLADHQIALAPHAIDTLRFGDVDGAHARRARDWRAELGISAQTRTLLFAGKLQPKKAPELLLKAFLSARSGSQRPSRLIFVGSGVLETQLRQLAEGCPEVLFLPFQNQQAMPAAYRLADVFVLPSRGPGETWGLALNESMASGVPIVASTRVGGARDLVKPGRNGWLFESENLPQLTAALREVLACDPERLRLMGLAAKEDSAGFTIQAAAQGIRDAVQRIAGAR